jgi:hypothetical protein
MRHILRERIITGLFSKEIWKIAPHLRYGKEVLEIFVVQRININAIL